MFARQGRDGVQVQKWFLVNNPAMDDDVIM
jgi:hypothetical protein